MQQKRFYLDDVIISDQKKSDQKRFLPGVAISHKKKSQLETGLDDCSLPMTNELTL